MNVRTRAGLDRCPAPSRRSSGFTVRRTVPVLELHGLTKHFGGVARGRRRRSTHGRARRDSRPDRGPTAPARAPSSISSAALLIPLTRRARRVSAARTFPISRRTTRVGRGIARTFQNIRLFGQLSVWQNLWVAQNSGEQRAPGESFVRRWLGGSRAARARRSTARSNSSTLGRQTRRARRPTCPSASSGASSSARGICRKARAGAAR